MAGKPGYKPLREVYRVCIEILNDLFNIPAEERERIDRNITEAKSEHQVRKEFLLLKEWMQGKEYGLRVSYLAYKRVSPDSILDNLPGDKTSAYLSIIKERLKPDWSGVYKSF